MDVKSEEKFITTSTLKSRGWTDSKIKNILGDPDKTAPNPHYKKGSPMKLYKLSRVEGEESKKDWINWFEKSKNGRRNLSEKLKAVAERKRKELFSYINSIEIEIKKIKEEDLYSEACNHYNKLWESRGEYDKTACIDSDKNFLNRISVNMLRHTYSIYEEKLADMFGEIGNRDAYFILKGRVLDEIGKLYPFLKNECEKQKLL